jgi:hypothetical protein
MVHKTTVVAKTMINYLEGHLGYNDAHVALLVESNSGVAQAIAESYLKKFLDTDNEFIFPLQVSEVRKEYERQGLLRSSKLDAASAAERLSLRPDESGTPTDVPHSFTPASSAALDEIALTQVLTTISHRRYHAVGIVATSPLE